MNQNTLLKKENKCENIRIQSFQYIPIIRQWIGISKVSVMLNQVIQSIRELKFASKPEIGEIGIQSECNLCIISVSCEMNHAF